MDRVVLLLQVLHFQLQMILLNLLIPVAVEGGNLTVGQVVHKWLHCLTSGAKLNPGGAAPPEKALARTLEWTIDQLRN